ncbi:MAG: ABC transporter ATP-binding protein [Oscillospiraceae bacterium]|jgi:putative ABC transport system ATP-binding protein|nr:ABC transporter ATP-binding protein [Oscillospiraceae bacterium]
MLLETKRVVKRYKRGSQTFNAVDGATLSLDPGEFAVIKGHSGSGKSTLLGIIAGVISSDDGIVNFAGQDTSRLDDNALSKLRNDKIGYIPQGHTVLANMTVLENVCLPRYIGERKDSPTAKALELLERLGISQLARQYPSELSGGELRRLSIARALLNSPELIIADEPVSDLDSEKAAEVWNLFAEAANGGTAVLAVTHSDNGLENINCKYFTMQNGGLTND